METLQSQNLIKRLVADGQQIPDLGINGVRAKKMVNGWDVGNIASTDEVQVATVTRGLRLVAANMLETRVNEARSTRAS